MEENLREEIRRKRGVNLSRKIVKASPSTPGPPWREELDDGVVVQDGSDKNLTFKLLSPTRLVNHNSLNNHVRSVSARQLAAALWEFQNYYFLRFEGSGANVEDVKVDKPESSSRSKRHTTSPLMQSCALHPESPTSFGNSIELARHDQVVNPASPTKLEGRIHDSDTSLKTSTELLKVLNRIWSLEEQHATNISLIKALKTKLKNARKKISDLTQNQQVEHHNVDDLMKQVTYDNLVRWNKERQPVNIAVQPVKDELENERELRKRSESLHRRLAHEIFEVKTSLSSAMKELEIERKSRILLEDLCDEFARGIQVYEQEVRALRQKHDDNWDDGAERDRSILHISESWLDERMQIKLQESQFGSTVAGTTLEKLHMEVEASLQHEQISNTVNTRLGRETKQGKLRRNSLESVPLDVVNSAPQGADDEDSLDSDSHCFELNKPNVGEFVPDQGEGEDKTIKLSSCERAKGRTASSLQVKFEECIAPIMMPGGSELLRVDAENLETRDDNHGEIFQKSECETPEDGRYKRVIENDEGQGSRSNLTRSHHKYNMYRKTDYGESSHSKFPLRGQVSPVRQSTSMFTTTDLNTSESSTKLVPGVKGNTLRAKLLEARAMGHRPYRSKPSKVTS